MEYQPTHPKFDRPTELLMSVLIHGEHNDYLRPSFVSWTVFKATS